MTFEELQQQGRMVAQNPADLTEQLHSLERDPCFPALLGWLQSRREQFIQAGAAQSMAAHHGPLAHCQGTVYAYDLLLTELRQIFDAAGKKKAATHVQRAD